MHRLQQEGRPTDTQSYQTHSSCIHLRLHFEQGFCLRIRRFYQHMHASLTKVIACSAIQGLDIEAVLGSPVPNRRVSRDGAAEP